ncbi:zinc finger CCCH domain-containing protein 13-like [Haliotis rufescens]|uniref:zinc finger CCCH domain-containing protein 13-like n=1 Tax=Haliotis rufescens TaxID=6454 RepID=UPI00201F0481|nr:zinc finger CCCH domain-containing protein 13-like [Haliotis rufescens]
MKQKDGDKHKPSTSYSSNKGKRKLEFDKKTSNLPLSGKIVYLDVKDVRQSRSLEEKLKQLGGTIEKFLIKDVNYVISSNAPASGQKKGEKGQDRPDSPAFQSTPSPFSMGQSPSPTAIEAKKETVTRGKAILQIAKNKSSQTSVADTAKKMGIKIVSLNGAITWLDKEIRKIKPAPVSTSNKQETRRRGTKIQRLKTPYVKFEAESCHYRPIMQQLKTWPHFNTETPQGTCPFDGRALGRPQNSERGDREEAVGVGNVLSPGTPQAQRDDLSGAQQVKSQSKTAKLDEPSNCKMFGVPIVTAGEIKRERERRKRENKRKGYCECCKEKYDDVDKHMRGLQHKNFARNKKNFDCIDTLIHKGPNTVSFLQRILLRHCVQKAANRNKDCSSQACDDGEVLLIEECSEKQSEKGGASNLPPEQLRVKRKMNRRLKYDRKIEKVTVEKTKLNKNVETCESRLGIVLDGQHHHHSSPRKPRSGSFPRVGRESCELESTSAVVIRRSGSRGLYGSPRRSQSASGSEKTLIIRDSPIASLQPLKDFLKRHSTNTGVRDGEKSSRFDEAGGKESRKRKSGASSSPVQEEKRHRQSDPTPVGDSTSGEVVLTKPSKCNRPDGKKGGSDAVSDKIVHSQLEKCVKDKPDREHSRVTRSSPRKRLDIDIESKVTSPRKSNRLSFQTENMSPLSDIVMRAENVIELSSKSVVVISKLDMESADSQLSLTSTGSPRRRSWKNKQKDSYCESEHVESHDDQGRVDGDDPDSKDRCKSRSKPRKYRDCGNDSEVEADVIVEKPTEVDEQRSRSKKRKDRDCGKGSQADDEADVEEFKEKDDQRSRSKKRKDRDCGKGSQADDEADVEEFKEKDDQRSRSKKRKDRDCGKGSQAEVTVKDCNGREAQRSCSKQKKHKDSREESVAQNKSDMNVECSNPGGKHIDSHKSRSPHMKKHGSKTHSDFIQNEADSIELSPTKGRSNSKKALRPSPNQDNKIQPTEVSTSSRTSPRKKHRTLVDLDVKSKDTNPSQEKTKADSKMLRADTAGEMVICNNETVVFTKRKKWKKVVRSSPQKKGRKLCKLKLDETSCSDYSCTSTMTSDVTPRKKAMPEQGESQSPVFKRRSRHSIKDLCHDVKENPESVELELKTPKREKFYKKGDIENEEGGTEVDTPKSGYCTTPRRRDRSWRSLRSNLVDETVCDGEDRRGEKDVKYVPETTPVKRVMMSRSRTSDTEMCCSPSRSRRARKSDESYQDMSEDKSTERKCSKISDSPRSRSRSTRNKPFEYGENAASASVPPSPNETLKKSRSTSTEKSPKRRKSSSPKKKETRGKRKWRQSKPSSRRKTVKLNRSWLILSERSMSKLLESEGDTQPFLGFQKEESDSRLPSDLTYEEVSEVDMSDDSTREWVMDEPDQDDEHRNDSEKNQGEDDIDNLWFPQFFPSPDKASNSSWGEACDSFLQTACERRLSGQTCSTPLVLPSNKVGTPRMRNKSPYCSPHRQLDTVKEDEDLDKTLVASDSYETPKKSRKISPRNLNRDESVDKGIVYNFNYRSPQKASRLDTGHERFRATTSKDDGLCLEYNKSVDSSGRKLRLLKKASSTKKTFHMSYVSKPVKSPKPAHRINISAASTVVVVSPKGKLK